jgi:hypothetical protein
VRNGAMQERLHAQNGVAPLRTLSSLATPFAHQVPLRWTRVPFALTLQL